MTNWLISFILFFTTITSTVFSIGHCNEDSAINFFISESVKNEKHHIFNKYEDIISGGAAFLIGNIGYFSTDSTALKLTYTAIQTIGILNIGKSIYYINSPSIESQFKTMLTQKDNDQFSRNEMANKILEIFAAEKRGLQDITAILMRLPCERSR